MGKTEQKIKLTFKPVQDEKTESLVAFLDKINDSIEQQIDDYVSQENQLSKEKLKLFILGKVGEEYLTEMEDKFVSVPSRKPNPWSIHLKSCLKAGKSVRNGDMPTMRGVYDSYTVEEKQKMVQEEIEKRITDGTNTTKFQKGAFKTARTRIIRNLTTFSKNFNHHVLMLYTPNVGTFGFPDMFCSTGASFDFVRHLTKPRANTAINLMTEFNQFVSLSKAEPPKKQLRFPRINNLSEASTSTSTSTSTNTSTTETLKYSFIDGVEYTRTMIEDETSQINKNQVRKIAHHVFEQQLRCIVPKRLQWEEMCSETSNNSFILKGWPKNVGYDLSVAKAAQLRRLRYAFLTGEINIKKRVSAKEQQQERIRHGQPQEQQQPEQLQQQHEESQQQPQQQQPQQQQPQQQQPRQQQNQHPRQPPRPLARAQPH